MWTRRDFLGAAIAAVATSGAAAETERYQLGCQTLPYRSHTLARALEGIRNAGYRYFVPRSMHAGTAVFTPALPAAARAALKRQFADAGLTPFLSVVALAAEMTEPRGMNRHFEELDLAADFGIRTVVGAGPWYYTKFPNLPKRARDWEQETKVFYTALEQSVRHAEQIGVTITLKPHTGITANAKACLQLMKRLPSERLKICWDAGNVSFYEGIHPDPDLPDLAPDVKSVCIKDHLGLRGEANFPVPGKGQIDFDLTFRVLCGSGFRGPVAVERVDGSENATKMPAELIDQRIAAARTFLTPILEKYSI